MARRTTTPRRLGVEGSKTRELLVEAAGRLLREEGYRAISARAVAKQAGLKPQLVYYYFLTMDDLMLAVVQRINANRMERFERALTAADPLRALWEMNSNRANARLSAELIVLASHHEAIRAEIVRQAEQFRATQTQAVAELLARRGVDTATLPPAGIVMIASALARTMDSEAALGISLGHAEALALVERTLAAWTGKHSA